MQIYEGNFISEEQLVLTIQRINYFNSQVNLYNILKMNKLVKGYLY